MGEAEFAPRGVDLIDGAVVAGGEEDAQGPIAGFLEVAGEFTVAGESIGLAVWDGPFHVFRLAVHGAVSGEARALVSLETNQRLTVQGGSCVSVAAGPVRALASVLGRTRASVAGGVSLLSASCRGRGFGRGFLRGGWFSCSAGGLFGGLTSCISCISRISTGLIAAG